MVGEELLFVHGRLSFGFVVWAGWGESLTLYSPFCHENTEICMNLRKTTNDIATMNMERYEAVSGCVTGITNFDTQFHIKYAPYTLGEHNNTFIIIRESA